MLLIPAGLLSRALYAAHTFDPGFDHRNVAVVSIDLRGPRYEKGNAAIFHEQWLERVRALPGVESVALASRIPLSPGRSQTTFRVGDEREATSRRREYRISRFLFAAWHTDRPRSRVHGRRNRCRARDRIHGAALLAGAGCGRSRHHHGRPASPHRGDRPRRQGVTGAGGDLELHVSARGAGTHNEASPFLHERAWISRDLPRRCAPRRLAWMPACS